MTLSVWGLFVTLSISDNQQNNVLPLCHYAECRILFTIFLNEIIVNVVAPKIALSWYILKD
jgi:hypothetical protein